MCPVSHIKDNSYSSHFQSPANKYLWHLNFLLSSHKKQGEQTEFRGVGGRGQYCLLLLKISSIACETIDTLVKWLYGKRSLGNYWRKHVGIVVKCYLVSGRAYIAKHICCWTRSFICLIPLTSTQCSHILTFSVLHPFFFSPLTKPLGSSLRVMVRDSILRYTCPSETANFIKYL